MKFPKFAKGSSLAETVKIENTRISIRMIQTEDLIVRKDGAEKLHIEIKSDWLLICFIFVMKSPG